MQFEPRRRSGLLRVSARAPQRTVRISAAVLALALLGDALLYVALPVDAPLFGVTAGGVGVLLSANRLVRIVGYGWIAAAAHRLGPRGLTLLAAVAATFSTIGYGLVRGVAALLVLRLVWGLAFGALSLTTIVYAIEESAGAGARLGASRALTALGPMVALTLGPAIAARWSSPVAFLAFGALTALAIPLAAALPRRTPAERAARVADGSRWGFLSRRSGLTWWSFSVGFAVDGVFAVSFALLVVQIIPVGTALAATGLVLASRYVAEVAFAPIAGRLGDRVGAGRLLARCTGFVAAGFVLMGVGAATGSPALWIGAAAVVIARGLLLPLGPAMLASSAGGTTGDGDPYRSQGDLAAWRDTGAALGPLVAGGVAGLVPAGILNAILACVLFAGIPSTGPEARRKRPLAVTQLTE